MKRENKKKNVYVNHRRNQREKILETSESLFIEKGIDQVTIAEIASESRLTRATIYKYFPSRKEIAFEIYKTIVSSWHGPALAQLSSQVGTGFQRIENFLISFRDYMMHSRREVSFVSEFNYLYGRQWEASQILQALGSLQDVREIIVDCVRRGIKDGSMRSDLDPQLTMAAIFNLNSSLIDRLGEMGKRKLQSEFGLPADQIISEIYRIFINGIKPYTESVRTKPLKESGTVYSRRASKQIETKGVNKAE
jgi:AcrR family transcriptional regulator